MSKEIQRAAIKYKHQIFTGFEHGECFKQIKEYDKNYETIQGFVTNDGDFVSRQEAFVIAKNANQLQSQLVTKILMSEDLHIDWLHKQDQKIKELEKALELLKDKNNYYNFVNENNETIDVDLAISKAKEMLKEE